MANYYGQTRTNYFAVKDPEAFKQEISKFPVELIEEVKDGVTLYGFIDNDENGAGFITEYWNEETDDTVEINLEDFFMRHLEDDYVAIVIHSGAEKYRYISGDVVAYNNKGESVSVNLTDIYDLAEKLGSKMTYAEY